MSLLHSCPLQPDNLADGGVDLAAGKPLVQDAGRVAGMPPSRPASAARRVTPVTRARVAQASRPQNAIMATYIRQNIIVIISSRPDTPGRWEHVPWPAQPGLPSARLLPPGDVCPVFTCHSGDQRG
jgi:hypothetical protein